MTHKAYSKKNIYIALIIYGLILVVTLLKLNSMRTTEKSYTYDLSTFFIETGFYNAEDSTINTNDQVGANQTFAYSPGTVLPSADYKLCIKYNADSFNTLHLYTNFNMDNYYTLPAGMNEEVIDFSVWPSADQFKVALICCGEGEFSVQSISIVSTTPIYTDYEFFMIMVVILGISIPLLIVWLRKKKGYGSKEFLTAFVLTIYSLVVSIPAFYSHLWMGTDTRHHLMRMQGVMTAIKELRFPTIINSNYCNNYGELSCIYPDKFLYLSGLLRNFKVSLVTSYNVTVILINVVAVVVMYFCSKHITKSRLASLVASGLYCFIPYRLYVMYGGGQAFGMGVAMVFFIVVFTAYYDIFLDGGKCWYLLPIGMSGLLSSHVLSFTLACILSVITIIVCMLISRATGKRLADINKPILQVIKSVAVTILVCLSTIVPFIYYSMQGLSVDKMQLDFMASLGDVQSNFLSENGIYHIGILALVIALFVIGKKKTEDYIDSYTGYAIYMLIMGFGLFWASTNVFIWNYLINIDVIRRGLDYFQFGERFMLAGSAAICIGTAMLISKVEICKNVKPIDENINKFKAYSLELTLGICVIMAMIIGIIKWNNDIKQCDPLCHDRITGDFYCTEVGYLPAGTDISYFESVVPNCGDWSAVENIEYIRNGSTIHYVYTNSSDDNYIEFPLFNYKGYQAYDANGEELTIVNSEHNRIQVTLVSSDEPQIIDICFKLHPAFRVCALISLVFLVMLYIYAFNHNFRNDIKIEQ